MNVKIEGWVDGKEIGLAKPTLEEDGQREEPELHIQDQVRNTPCKPPKAGSKAGPVSPCKQPLRELTRPFLEG